MLQLNSIMWFHVQVSSSGMTVSLLIVAVAFYVKVSYVLKHQLVNYIGTFVVLTVVLAVQWIARIFHEKM